MRQTNHFSLSQLCFPRPLFIYFFFTWCFYFLLIGCRLSVDQPSAPHREEGRRGLGERKWWCVHCCRKKKRQESKTSDTGSDLIRLFSNILYLTIGLVLYSVNLIFPYKRFKYTCEAFDKIKVWPYFFNCILFMFSSDLWFMLFEIWMLVLTMFRLYLAVT